MHCGTLFFNRKIKGWNLWPNFESFLHKIWFPVNYLDFPCNIDGPPPYFSMHVAVIQCIILHRLWLPFVVHALLWRHNDDDGVSNHQPHGCLLNRLFRRRSKKISKLRVTGLCAGNSPGTGEFPAQRACYAENVSIWWRHHGLMYTKWL